MPVQASDHARIKVLSVLVPGRGLLIHTGSTVAAIAQDGPISERGRDKHPDELEKDHLNFSSSKRRDAGCENGEWHSRGNILEGY